MTLTPSNAIHLKFDQLLTNINAVTLDKIRQEVNRSCPVGVENKGTSDTSRNDLKQ